MSQVNEKSPVLVNTTYEIFVFLIVLLSIANSVLLLLLDSPEARRVVWIIELCISLFLIADAVQRLVRAPQKRRFLIDYRGWMILVGSLPVPGLRLLRLLQTILMARSLRRSDYAAMETVVMERRAASTLALVAFLAVLVLEIGGIMILRAETGSPAANIKTASDALWWGYVTVATVGYGDKYPVTNAGRLVGVLMMTIGVGLFGVITGFLADWFRRPRKAPFQSGASTPPPDHASATVEEIRRLIEAQEQAYRSSTAEIKARLAALEAASASAASLSPTASRDRIESEEVR